MPSYPGVVGATVPAGFPPKGLYPGDSVYLFGTPTNILLPLDASNVTGELLTVNESSICVAIPQAAARGVAPSVSIELIFSATPGTYEIDVMEADTEADALYINPTNAAYQISAKTQATGSGVFVARADFSPAAGKFCRLFVKTWPNPTVTCIAKITRQ